jgi:hypothetical protein
MFLLDILVNPVVRLEIFIDTVFIIISSWRRIFEKKGVIYFFLYWASKRFLQEHGHAFAYLIIITRAWSCIFLYITFVIYSFIRVIQTGYTCARALSLLFDYKEKKEEEENYTECLRSYVRRHCQAWSMSFFCILSMISSARSYIKIRFEWWDEKKEEVIGTLERITIWWAGNQQLSSIEIKNHSDKDRFILILISFIA